MYVDTRIIPASEFLRTTATGELDFGKAKEILKQAATSVEHGFMQVLLDFRDVSACGGLSPSQIWSLVQVFEEHPSLRARRIALLLRGDAPGVKAKLFELCANNRGFSVQIFNEVEQAIYWLVDR